MGATTKDTNQEEVVNSARMSPRSARDSHGGTHPRRTRSIRVGESEVPIVVAPLPPTTAEYPGAFGSFESGKPFVSGGGSFESRGGCTSSSCGGGGCTSSSSGGGGCTLSSSGGGGCTSTSSGGGGGCTSSSSPDSVMVEGQVGDSSGDSGNGNGGKKPAWNKPSNGSNFKSGPVIGDEELWPPLSESTKASQKLSSPDLSKVPVHPGLHVHLSPVPGNPPSSSASAPPSSPASPSSPSLKHGTGNVKSNPTQYRGRHPRQKPMKQEGGGSGLPNAGAYHPSSPTGLVGEGSHNNNNNNNNALKFGSGGIVEGLGSSRDRDQVQNNATRETSGPHYRGDCSHQGWRDHDRGNPEWNHQRNFSSRDPYVQPPRPFARSPMRPPPPPPVHAPVMPASSFQAPFVAPVMPPDYPHMVYYNPPVLNPFVAQVHPMFIPPHDAVLPQDIPLPERIVKQIDYYFSNENLVRDTFLRKHMDEQGWVSILLVADFKKMKQLTNNIQLILDSIKGSSAVEVQGDKIRKRNDWEKWIMPPSLQLPNAQPPNLLADQLQNMTIEERIPTVSSGV